MSLPFLVHFLNVSKGQGWAEGSVGNSCLVSHGRDPALDQHPPTPRSCEQ